MVKVVQENELESHEVHQEVEDKDQVCSNGEPLSAEVPGGQPVDPGTRGPEFVLLQLPGERVAVVPETEVLWPFPAKAGFGLGKRPSLAICRDAGHDGSQKNQETRLHYLLPRHEQLSRSDVLLNVGFVFLRMHPYKRLFLFC